jgi:hypothetical protein
MNIKTLKALIAIEIERGSEPSKLKDGIFRLLDLYDSEIQPKNFTPNPLITNPCYTDDKVPYCEICSCNPKNGGSGICGCIMGNKLVDRNGGKSNWATTTAGTTPYQGGAPYSWTYGSTSYVNSKQ